MVGTFAAAGADTSERQCGIVSGRCRSYSSVLAPGGVTAALDHGCGGTGLCCRGRMLCCVGLLVMAVAAAGYVVVCCPFVVVASASHYLSSGVGLLGSLQCRRAWRSLVAELSGFWKLFLAGVHLLLVAIHLFRFVIRCLLFVIHVPPSVV